MWSPTPTDTYEKGLGWSTSTTVTPQPAVPGWSSAPQPVYAFADAIITVTAAGQMVMHGSADAEVDPAAVTALTGAATGDATLLGEGTVFFSHTEPLADATTSITSTADTSTVTDTGLPYTIPFVLGGAAVIATYSNADATITVTASADVLLAADANADFTILADASAAGDVTGGLPYTLPFVIAGSVGGSVLPVDIPFVL